MSIRVERHVRVAIHPHGGISRRSMLKWAGGAGLAAGLAGWTDLVRLHADDLRRRNRACILVWLQGGASQLETFDPKPGHANGGETKAIDTNVPGIQLSENLPELARVMDKVALIRSMTTKEGNHQRASFLLHTGYVPTASIKHPAFGAHVAREIGDASFALPSFVRVGGRLANAGGGGYLGVEFDPFSMPNPGQMPENTEPGTDLKRYARRLDLLGRLEQGYADAGGAQEVAEHQKLYGKASRMITSPEVKAFDLSTEPDAMRESYGATPIGSGCLLARRLVETGVTFVEIASNGWDTHDNNFERTKTLCGQIDQPVARLLSDLDDRGLLESTLVVVMGEFGRTPNINGRGGRDHYPRAFSLALAGAGIKGGQVIGATDEGGVSVSDRPVAVGDLFQTFCRALGIDGSKETMTPVGRPMKIVDGGSCVNEVFG
jgi:hypothetical protein